MYGNNGKTSIFTLYNVLLVPDLCDQLFSIIMLMNSVHTCFFHSMFFTVFFSDNYQNAAILPHSAQIKYALLVKMKENSKSRRKIPKKKDT